MTNNEPTQLQLTVTYRYTPDKASYASPDNMNPTMEDMAEIDLSDLKTGTTTLDEFVDYDLVEYEIKPVTDRP